MSGIIFQTLQPVLESRHAELTTALEKLDAMTGGEFEDFVEGLFQFCGVATRRTPSGADQGADLLAEGPGGALIAVQAKRYAANVGNAAVQEVLGAMHFFNCDLGLVIATAPYTRAARELAAKCHDVCLWERSDLSRLLLAQTTFEAMLRIPTS